jgi:SAM-dependent methyltransferase
MRISDLIGKLHSSRFFGSIFHTLDYCVEKELEGCGSVLDLGCGPSSPIRNCKWVKRSVGVEVFEPYLNKSKEKGIHSEYILSDVKKVDFPEGSFDAVLMLEVLEHLSEEDGMEMIEKAKKWCSKKVIISSPNGYIHQKEVDGNPYQKHLSGWDLRKMRSLGFKCRGLAGFKFLRQEVQNDVMGDDLLTSIRFKPRFLWFVVATLSQIFCYSFPRSAFELFSVYRKK